MKHVIIAICVVLTALLAWLLVREAGTQGNRALERLLPDGRRTVAETFREYLVSVSAAGGDELLVSEVKTSVEITLDDTRREFWTGASLGTSSARVSAPVTYRYYIRLSDRWTFALDSGTLWLVRPLVRPQLPPAIDSAGLATWSENGWLRWNREELRERLLRELTPQATARAPQHLDAARPAADAAIAAFARTWLVKATGNPEARVALCDAVPAGLPTTIVTIR
jgi:hypothetical protein